MKYIVTIKEIHTYDTEVEASCPREALEKAEDELTMGEIDEAFGDLEYSHTLPPENWNVNPKI